jgi:hypothetical protein
VWETKAENQVTLFLSRSRECGRKAINTSFRRAPQLRLFALQIGLRDGKLAQVFAAAVFAHNSQRQLLSFLVRTFAPFYFAI